MRYKKITASSDDISCHQHIAGNEGDDGDTTVECTVAQKPEPGRNLKMSYRRRFAVMLFWVVLHQQKRAILFLVTISMANLSFSQINRGN